MTPRRFARLWMPAAGLSGVVIFCLAAPWFRPFPHDELLVTLAWSLAHLVAFAGWGTALTRLCDVTTSRPSLALRAVWGAGGFVFVGGVLAACSLLGKWFFLAFLYGGASLQTVEWIQRREALARGLRVRLRATRLHAGAFVFVAFLAAAVGAHYLGGASNTSSNPFDDDPAYYTFAKMLLERGTLLDPYSFRRMSTLGGQALFHASLLTRISFAHLNVFDRSMCVLLTAGMIASFRVDGRKPPFVARALALLLVLALPNTSINAASYYSATPLFLGLLQSYEILGPRGPEGPRQTARRLAPLALVGAAICTLRQNYQATVGLFLLLAYAGTVVRKHKTEGRRVWQEPVTSLALLALFVLPWMALLYRSNGTPLFPVMKGTFNPQVNVSSQLMTTAKVFRFVVDVWLTPEPLSTQPLFFLAALVGVDAGRRRTMKSFAVASVLSIVVLSVAFSLSDSGNLARYYYGFVVAGSLAAWLNLASTWHPQRRSQFLPMALALFALVYPLLGYRKETAKLYAGLLKDTDEQLRRTGAEQMDPPIADAYRRIQGAAPAGVPIVYLLDRPFFLDFRRNELLNLDSPGLASPAPGMPNFEGSEALAQYLIGQGVHHVAFVKSEHSTYFYRQNIWLENIYGPDELWRSYAPFLLDTLENLEDLTRTRRILHEEAGMVLVDLDQPSASRDQAEPVPSP